MLRLLTFLALLGIPATALCTTVAARLTKTEIVVAADSKVVRGLSSSDAGTFCKIRKVGDHYMAVAGLVADYGSGYALVESVGHIWDTKKSFSDNVRQVNYGLSMPIWSELDHVRHLNPLVFDARQRDQDAVQLLFFGFEKKKPVAAFMWFFIPAKNNALPFRLHSYRSACPGDACPGGKGTLILGLRGAADGFLAQHPKHWRGDTVAAVRKLVEVEIEANREWAGLPIDILRVTKDGAHWIQRKPECDESTDLPRKGRAVSSSSNL